jgi:hypothetical protein
MECSSTPTLLLLKEVMYVPRLIFNKNLGTLKMSSGTASLLCMLVLCLYFFFVRMPDYFEPRLKFQVLYAV